MTESPKRMARRIIGDAIGRQHADAVLDALTKAGLVLVPKTLTPEIARALEDAAPPSQRLGGDPHGAIPLLVEDYRETSGRVLAATAREIAEDIVERIEYRIQAHHPRERQLIRDVIEGAIQDDREARADAVRMESSRRRT